MGGTIPWEPRPTSPYMTLTTRFVNASVHKMAGGAIKRGSIRLIMPNGVFMVCLWSVYRVIPSRKLLTKYRIRTEVVDGNSSSTLNPTPNTLNLHPTPYTLNQIPCRDRGGRPQQQQHPKPSTLNPKP